jgi:cellulose synthase/poly-beta-1,6-N-acetylglucosamine synthase-like glycosyltransferase
VDDHSSDNTAELIQDFCNNNTNWKFLCLDKKSEELKGKKNALLQGIALAQGEIIFTTDADCTVPEGWLRGMVRYFPEDTSMVLGYSPLAPGKGLLFRLLQFDNIFSAISAAAPTKLGYPFTSAGRNLAYRKDAYENAGGFLALKKFRSGDDVHMTERFRYLNSGNIDYCADTKTFVSTKIPDTSKEIFHQQIRKNSKLLKKAATSIVFSLILFLYYLSLIVIPIFMPQWLNVWLILLFIKLGLEYINLLKAAMIFNQSDLVPFIPLMQMIYPIYIIFFSLLGSLGLYSWKK